jgi:DNA-binding MarR family transcriptional regulator
MTPPTVTQRERAAWRSVALMGRRLAVAAEQRLQAEAGVSVPDFEILQALAAAPSHRARPVELGEMLSWEKSRISHHVTRMAARGLVERVECDTDQRGTWVGITDAGREALRQAVPVHEGVIRAALIDPLDPAQVDAIAAAALAVVRANEPGSCAAEVDRLERETRP